MKNAKNNVVELKGTIVTEFQYSHEMVGEKFYVVYVESMRNSGVVDRVPIIISERLTDVTINCIGKFAVINGEFRSYNKKTENKSSLLLHLFVNEIHILEKKLEDENYISLTGFVCKPPIYRTTPLGREIADVMLATNRSYGKSDYIPCILWGRNAKYAQKIEVGMTIKVEGRIQSRKYVKKYDDYEEERTTYEVSVNVIEMLDKVIQITVADPEERQIRIG